LIQAAPAILSEFPNSHFVFAGKPEGRQVLDRQIAELNLSGKFSILGFRTDTINLLRDSDVFVLPSLAEGFSLSIIEALSAGLPVVATRVGGADEVIDDGRNGFLVPPSDADALSQTVIRALSLSGSEKLRIRQEALRTARRFSSEETARQTFGVYSQVLSDACQNPG
jgi:glycosyltransferase involved in cell wall biosynthesis